MPLTFKESNLHIPVVALISLKQNQYRIVEENNKVNFTYDDLKALRRFLRQLIRLQGSDATCFIILSAYQEK